MFVAECAATGARLFRVSLEAVLARCLWGVLGMSWCGCLRGILWGCLFSVVLGDVLGDDFRGGSSSEGVCRSWAMSLGTTSGSPGEDAFRECHWMSRSSTREVRIRVPIFL